VLRAEHPSQDFVAALRYLDQRGSLACGFPYEFLFSGSESGGAPFRGAFEIAGREIERLRNQVHRPRLDVISYVTIMDGVERGLLPAKAGITRGSWQFTTLPSADAFRDAKSDIDQIRAGITSPQRVIANNLGTTADAILSETREWAIMVSKTVEDANRELVKQGYKPTVTAQDVAQVSDNPQAAAQAENLTQGKPTTISDSSTKSDTVEKTSEAPKPAAMAGFDESKHPRADDGKFGEGEGHGKASADANEASKKTSEQEHSFSPSAHADAAKAHTDAIGHKQARIEAVKSNPHLNEGEKKSLIAGYKKDIKFHGAMAARHTGTAEHLDKFWKEQEKREGTTAKLADFDESKHPRAKDGEFGSGGGASKSPNEPAAKTGENRQDTASPKFKEWFGDSKIADEGGNPLVVYHETSQENAISIRENGFDVSRVNKSGRVDDDQVPDGIFLKETPNRIGVAKNGEQMPFYASIKNPLLVKDRKAADALFRENILNYPMKNAADSRLAITNFIVKNGYDGMILGKDSVGLRTIIALHPMQIKHMQPTAQKPAKPSAALAFDESKHPRAKDGEFGSGGGGGKKGEKEKKSEAPKEKEQTPEEQIAGHEAAVKSIQDHIDAHGTSDLAERELESRKNMLALTKVHNKKPLTDEEYNSYVKGLTSDKEWTKQGDQWVHESDTGAKKPASPNEPAAKTGNLASKEKEIASLPKERGHIVNDKGEVTHTIEQSGGTSELNLSPEHEKAAKNATFTHNHPAGTAISAGDFFQAQRLDMKQMRAVTPDGVHVIDRPENGWPDMGKMVGAQQEASAEAVREAIGKGITDKKEGSKFVAQKTAEGMAQRLGIPYRLESTQPTKKNFQKSFSP